MVSASGILVTPTLVGKNVFGDHISEADLVLKDLQIAGTKLMARKLKKAKEKLPQRE